MEGFGQDLALEGPLEGLAGLLVVLGEGAEPWGEFQGPSLVGGPVLLRFLTRHTLGGTEGELWPGLLRECWFDMESPWLDPGAEK